MFEPEKVVEKYQEGLKDELIKDFTDLQWCMQYYYYKKEEFDEEPIIRNATLFGIQRVVNRLNRIDGVWNQDVALKRKIYNLPRIIRDSAIDTNWNKVWNFAIKDLPKIVKMCIGDDKYAECMEKAYYGRFNSVYGSDVMRMEFYFKDNVDLKELEEYREIIYDCYKEEKVKCLVNTNEKMYFEVKEDEYALCKMFIPINEIITYYDYILKSLKEVYYYSDEGKDDVLNAYVLREKGDSK